MKQQFCNFFRCSQFVRDGDYFSGTMFSQVPQPLLLVVGWVYNAPKTAKFFFDTFHSFHLVTHWKKVIEIG